MSNPRPHDGIKRPEPTEGPKGPSGVSFSMNKDQLMALKVAKATEWAKAAELIERNFELSKFALRQMMLDKYYEIMDDVTDGEFTKAKQELENKFMPIPPKGSGGLGIQK